MHDVECFKAIQPYCANGRVILSSGTGSKVWFYNIEQMLHAHECHIAIY